MHLYLRCAAGIASRRSSSSQKTLVGKARPKAPHEAPLSGPNRSHHLGWVGKIPPYVPQGRGGMREGTGRPGSLPAH